MAEMEWIAANWPSVILALALIPVTIILTIKYGPAKRPRYAYTQQRLLTRNHPQVKIEFAGKEIENLHVVRFCFWNAGRKEIRSEDIPSHGGPRVVLPPSAEVLSVSTEESDTATGATMGGDLQTSLIEFEYLNHRDGLQSELIYTLRAEAEDPSFAIQGSLKGSRAVRGERWHGTGLGEVMLLTLLASTAALLGVVAV